MQEKRPAAERRVQARLPWAEKRPAEGGCRRSGRGRRSGCRTSGDRGQIGNRAREGGSNGNRLGRQSNGRSGAPIKSEQECIEILDAVRS